MIFELEVAPMSCYCFLRVPIPLSPQATVHSLWNLASFFPYSMCVILCSRTLKVSDGYDVVTLGLKHLTYHSFAAALMRGDLYRLGLWHKIDGSKMNLTLINDNSKRFFCRQIKKKQLKHRKPQKWNVEICDLLLNEEWTCDLREWSIHIGYLDIKDLRRYRRLL